MHIRRNNIDVKPHVETGFFFFFFFFGQQNSPLYLKFVY